MNSVGGSLVECVGSVIGVALWGVCDISGVVVGGGGVCGVVDVGKDRGDRVVGVGRGIGMCSFVYETI